MDSDRTLMVHYPFLSVIIPVLNERLCLPLLLKDLALQQYPRDRWEIIVADGGSVDGTVDFVRSQSGDYPVALSLVPNLRRRSSAGRNAGVKAARGEIVAFIDGHTRVQNPQLLLRTAELFETTGAHCLCRAQPLVGLPGNRWSENIAATRASRFGHGSASLIYDRNFIGPCDPRSSGAVYRREVFKALGLYDESFDACEDVEFNTRLWLSGKLAYAHPDLAIDYQARSTIRGLWRQMVRYGQGRVRLARKHRSERSIRSLAPAMLVILLMTATGVWFSWVCALPLVAYVAVIVLLATVTTWNDRRRSAFAAAVILPVIHLGLGTGMLMETISGAGPQTFKDAALDVGQINVAIAADETQHVLR
ncbi:Glycosyl transferase family 2 [Terriglobus roseus]|uniref:Glycosyl transferase family 2 n=2 Tax=Terriglobus roseus TaxID=392734 RepID=A0A1H4SJ32_9BACT|nr:Glycosyl transferase family 2 [Terriglobus roseus]